MQIIEAQTSNGEQLRTVPVGVDTGTDTSCVDERWAQVLRLHTETMAIMTSHGITGKPTSKSCAKFTIEIGGKGVQVDATVIQALGAALRCWWA